MSRDHEKDRQFRDVNDRFRYFQRQVSPDAAGYLTVASYLADIAKLLANPPITVAKELDNAPGASASVAPRSETDPPQRPKNHSSPTGAMTQIKWQFLPLTEEEAQKQGVRLCRVCIGTRKQRDGLGFGPCRYCDATGLEPKS